MHPFSLPKSILEICKKKCMEENLACLYLEVATILVGRHEAAPTS